MVGNPDLALETIAGAIAPDAESDTLPALKPSVVLLELGGGEYVVKDPKTQAYFHAGESEFFLLRNLAEGVSYPELRSRYSLRFGEDLERADLDPFLETLVRRGLMEPTLAFAWANGSTSAQVRSNEYAEDDIDTEHHGPPSRWGKGSLLYYRLPLLDPDKILTRIVDTVPWIWTKGFLLASLLVMLSALCVLASQRDAFAVSVGYALRWETLLLVGVISFFVTALHETAHGATCKRFGGEVREAGVLIMMMIPCLYINVSDAWTIKERWKRMLITAAGGYMDLCMWAICVFLWRISLPGTLFHHLAFIVMSTCGARGLINFNPLLRFDGYYLLGDYLRISNLYAQGREYWMRHLVWLFWGAERPEKKERGATLLLYGFMSWSFAVSFLSFLLLNLMGYVSLRYGVLGFCFGAVFMTYAVRRVFRGFIGTEFIEMLKSRTSRTIAWVGALGGCTLLLFLVPVPYYAVGEFEVRPSECVDVPFPVPSFIQDVVVDDGAFVSQGDVLVHLRSPDLVSQIEAKEAELKESVANLQRLRAGSRPEEILEQESRVRRLTSWCELGRVEVETTKEALKHQLEALEHRIGQARTELQHAEKAIGLSERLAKQGALAEAQLERERTKVNVLRQRVAEVESQRSVAATEGVRVAVAEMARREQELADAEAKLRLLRLGSRPEDIAAEEARKERLSEELDFLTIQVESMKVIAPVAGHVSSCRLREKTGGFGAKGSLLCQIQRQGLDRIEVNLPEDDALTVTPGQKVTFKARALPLETFHGEIVRIAPTTQKPVDPLVPQKLNTKPMLVLHCRIEGVDGKLKSGMSGFARVSRGWSTLGRVIQLKAYQYLRTEFWW